jgi:hypothetical protein
MLAWRAASRFHHPMFRPCMRCLAPLHKEDHEEWAADLRTPILAQDCSEAVHPQHLLTGYHGRRA